MAGIALACLASTGCYRGYKSASALESDKRDPKSCAATCKEFGLKMSAFVLVEHATSACVCAPADAPTAGDGAAAAAAQLLLQQNKQAADRAQSLTAVPPP